MFWRRSLRQHFAASQETASNPAKDKFQQDIKASVLNGSMTIPQVKELQTNAEILKSYKAEQKPGAPVDLLTPWHAVSKMKAVMASVKQPDRDTLEQDLQVMMANKETTPVSTETPNPGAKLGKRYLRRRDAWQADRSPGEAATG